MVVDGHSPSVLKAQEQGKTIWEVLYFAVPAREPEVALDLIYRSLPDRFPNPID